MKIFIVFFLLLFTTVKASDLARRKNCAVRCFSKCIKKERPSECTVKCIDFFNGKLCDDEDCWSRCKDLGPTVGSPPPPPADISVSLDDRFRLNVRWKAVAGADVYVVSYTSTNWEMRIPIEEFSTGAELLGIDVTALLCDTVEVSVASASFAAGRGTLSQPVHLRPPQPNVTLSLQSLTLEDEPYSKYNYESNQTVHVVLQYHIREWILGVDDLTVKPVFIMQNCEDPDLSSAIPEATLVEDKSRQTFETDLASTLMERKCNHIASIDTIHSNRCKRKYDATNRPLRIVLNCNSVTNCRNSKSGSRPPSCGHTKNFHTSIINGSDVDWDDPHALVTVNITFDYDLNFGRRTALSPLYYLARYGNAVDYNNSDERALVGVALVNELGRASNCLQIENDGTCKRYSHTNNSIVISNLTVDTLYGVIICAVLDAHNLTLPPVNVSHRHLGKRTDRLEICSADYRSGRAWSDPWRLLIGGLLVLFILIVLAIVLWSWNNRRQTEMMRKKLSMIEAQQKNDQRYTELPKKADVWELERRNLIIYDDKRLGSGAFGSVYLGRLIGVAKGSKDAQSALGANLMRADNCDVAVKMLPEYADELSKSEFLREISLMKSLGYHERLVNMLACVTNSEPFCLVVEYCADGDLLMFLRKRCEYMLELDEKGINYSDPNNRSADNDFDPDMIMTMRQLLQFAVQISYGLEYLSQKGFVHRDVAARNVLVHDRQYAKIGDFGLCRFIYAQTANYKGNGGRLPVKWMSPEAIRDYEFTTKSDVWSFGVLLFEIITLGGTPYPGIQPNDILEYLESGKRLAKPDNCPDELYEIMSLCWHLRPSERPEFAMLRRRLARQLEAAADEYSYLKLDAQKDYYNVASKELLEQAGADVEDSQKSNADCDAESNVTWF